MGDAIITVSNLGKRYQLAHAVRTDTLRDTLMHSGRHLAGRLLGRAPPDTREDFWALREVGFEVERGEVVGIIGRNGAGKSTLLKILSRITEPTTGTIRLRGRVASLLEVGTGFHPELSGRENIFLNGAILGMSRVEIRRKFDEIVAFAEVERFLDTPVKHYSSGMYVRLAFAVAAHLEPEILIVDEVLAVGDQRFQAKCMGKIQSVAKSEGRTVLLVSHNMASILSLCTRCLHLKDGRLLANTSPDQAVAAYISVGAQSQYERSKPPGRCSIMRAEVRPLSTPDGSLADVLITIRSEAPLRLAVEIKLHDAIGQPIALAALGSLQPGTAVSLHAGEQTLRCRFPLQQLANGRYSLSLKLAIPFLESLDECLNCLSFEYEPSVPPGFSHNLQQSWGAGCFVLPATLVEPAQEA